MKCAKIDKCGLENEKRLESDALEREIASKKLKRAIVLCVFFMGVEVMGGLYANSLAILTDAAHLLCDIAGFAISLFAIWATSWESTAIQSYGFFRLEILGALVSIQFIWLVTGMLLYEAVGRLFDSENVPVDGRIMLGVAMLGLFVNISMMVLLGHGNHGMHLGGRTHDDGHGNHRHKYADDSNKTADDSDKRADDSDKMADYNHGHYHHKYDHVKGQYQHISFNEHGEHPKHALGMCLAKPMNVLKKHDVNEPVRGKDIDLNILDKKLATTVINKTMVAKHHKHSNLNLEGAYLHVLGDALQSVGVMIGGVAIWYNPEWKIIDVICTLMFSMLVLSTTIQMLKDILHILMESTPREINAQIVKLRLEQLPGVVTVHELHIWALTMGKILLTCHICAFPKANHDEVLKIVIDYLESQFKITHATIQIETAL